MICQTQRESMMIGHKMKKRHRDWTNMEAPIIFSETASLGRLFTFVCTIVHDNNTNTNSMEHCVHR